MKDPSPKLVLVANLERIRAFRMTPNDIDHPRPWSIEELDPPLAERIERSQPAHVELSDQAGRFPAEGGPGMSAGDAGQHAREREDERKNIQQLADCIHSTVSRESFKHWNLAAPDAILQRLTKALARDVRERLTSTERHDYTKLPIKKIEAIFAPLP